MRRISVVVASNLAILVSMFVFLPVFAQANQAQLPDPGILPDNPFYGLKRTFESIWTNLTFGDDAKALRKLEVAQTRLAEALAMTNSEKSEFVPSLLHQYALELENANTLGASLPNGTKSVVFEKIADATSRHGFVFQEMKDKVPEYARLVVESASESSIKENIRALHNLAAENPKKAEEIATHVSDAKLDAAFEANRKGDYKETKQALKELNEYKELVEQIKTKAKQTEKQDSDNNHEKANSKKNK